MSQTPPKNSPPNAAAAPFRHSPFVRAENAYATPPYPAPIDLHLDGNEGIAISQTLLQELGNLDVEAVRRYPKNQPLEQQLAARLGLSPAQVLVTAGADDALERAIRTAVRPGDEVLMPVPTFEMIERYVLLAGGRVVSVPWLDGPLPLNDLTRNINDATGLIVVVTPNSPTGLTASMDAITAIAEAAPDRMLLVDLAYIEFADRDITHEVLQLPNAVVTRTLSKAYGIAGARVGYALGSPEAIALLRAAGHPYAVSSLSLALATHRLQADDAPMQRWISKVRSERADLIALLRDRGISVTDSEGNFICVTHPQAADIRNGLALRGIGVRGFPHNPLLRDSLRVTLPGDDNDFARLYDAFQNLT
ncbi:MAG: histidinol-phosphate aminotransferase family protein [Myxococcales bacterium]|nr:histidinol-phosphate aminotransferase family protein [Myxococcales bacterium]